MKRFKINFTHELSISNHRSLIYTILVASIISISECKQQFDYESFSKISPISKNDIKDIEFLQKKGDNKDVDSTNETLKTGSKYVKKNEKQGNNNNEQQKTEIETKKLKSTIKSHNSSSANNADNSDKSALTIGTEPHHLHKPKDAKYHNNEDKSNRNNHIRGNDYVNEHGNKHNTSHLEGNKTDNRYAVIIISVSTLIFSIFFQWIGGFIENKVDSQHDQYVSNVFNTCCRQVATISLINLVLWILLQSKIALSLDRIFFEDVTYLIYKNHISEGVLKTNTIEIAFEYSLYISVLLMMW